MLADIGEHVIGDGDELDVDNSDARFLESLTNSTSVWRLAEVEVAAGCGPEPAPVADKKELAITDDDAADANVGNFVWNCGGGHTKRPLFIKAIQSRSAVNRKAGRMRSTIKRNRNIIMSNWRRPNYENLQSMLNFFTNDRIGLTTWGGSFVGGRSSRARSCRKLD
jgi:hypothetical protein